MYDILNDLSLAKTCEEDDVPGRNCLASNSQGDLPGIVWVTLGLKSIISAPGLPPTNGIPNE